MNERIRDLGVRAGLYVDLNGTPWPRAMSAEACELAYAKFAELIVQECAEVAHCNFHVDGLTLGGIMKKHCGVE